MGILQIKPSHFTCTFVSHSIALRLHFQGSLMVMKQVFKNSKVLHAVNTKCFCKSRAIFSSDTQVNKPYDNPSGLNDSTFYSQTE